MDHRPNAGPRILVLARHGESANNAKNLFTGLADAPLTERGRREATALGRRLAEAGLRPQTVFTSTLSRAADTATLAAAALGLDPSAIVVAPELNERDYGALTGFTEEEAGARWDPGSVRRWRRSYAEAPPDGESLRDVNARLLPYYLSAILPEAMRGIALVVAHGNCLRALVAVLDGLTPAAVEALEIPTGGGFVYEFGADTTIARRTAL